MKSDYNRDELLEEGGQDFDAIHELSDSMIRSATEMSRSDSLSAQPQTGGKRKPYQYFYSVLNPASWHDYAVYVQSRQHSVDLAIQWHSELCKLSEKPSGLGPLGDLQSHLDIPAKGIRELDLTWRLALHLEQSWASYQDGEAARTRDCDIEPIKTVQKFHSSRCIFWS
jgi:hypothetical protein